MLDSSIADWIMTPVPPGGGEVGLNSTVGPCSDPGFSPSR
jgi:hypothetical protein